MICRFSVANFKPFAERVELDFYGNGNIKRLDYNCIEQNGKSILKTIGIYGPNNTGKTWILKALACLRSLMLNEFRNLHMANDFAGKGSVTSFQIEYCIEGRFYVYSLDYNSATKEYKREKLQRKTYEGNSVQTKTIFDRNGDKLTWLGMGQELKELNMLQFFSPAFPFMMVFNNLSDPTIDQAKADYLRFAQSLTSIYMDQPLNISETIRLMESDPKAKEFIRQFVLNCDLHVDDFGFADDVVSDVDATEELQIAMSNPALSKETLKFYSCHNGFRVPSLLFDSVGTQKLVALAGYIYAALKDGKVLIVDEIDSSLHHIITNSIVAMFSNILNVKSQLVFTTHDVLLLDLKELFRKDQIYLVDVKDRSSSEIIRMSDRFTARAENGIRGDEDITGYYLKGQFGGIPTPDLFAALEVAISDE